LGGGTGTVLFGAYRSVKRTAMAIITPAARMENEIVFVEAMIIKN